MIEKYTDERPSDDIKQFRVPGKCTAASIAWRGLSSTSAYKKMNEFNINGTMVDKSEVERLGVAHLISQLGGHKCD